MSMAGVNHIKNKSGDNVQQATIFSPASTTENMQQVKKNISDDIIHNVLQPSYVKDVWSIAEMTELFHNDVMKDTHIKYRDLFKGLINTWEQHLPKDMAQKNKTYKIMKKINEMVSVYCEYAEHSHSHAFDEAIKKLPSWLDAKKYQKLHINNLFGKLFYIAAKKKLNEGFIHLTHNPQEARRSTQKINRELKQVLEGQSIIGVGDPTSDELQAYIEYKRAEKKNDS